MAHHSDAVYERVLDAMRHLEVNYVEGQGATDQPARGLTCTRCRGSQIRYTGSDVLEGSLEHYHLVHTEVDHHLSCLDCGASWTVFKML